jgi:hypothetical protein
MTTTQRPRHPLCTTLALLLTANQRNTSDFDYAIHDIIAHLTDLADWSDEKKADLYARLAESVSKDDRLVDIERKVSVALWQNESFPYV